MFLALPSWLKKSPAGRQAQQSGALARTPGALERKVSEPYESTILKPSKTVHSPKLEATGLM